MKILKSDCGKYLAKRKPEFGTRYDLLDANGNLLGETTWWATRSTKTQIAFEIGNGTFSATFSYPRYPTWFRRRWIECFHIDCNSVSVIVEKAGGKVLRCYKPDWNCWIHLGFRGTRAIAQAVDNAMVAVPKVKSFDRQQRGTGMLEISCPDIERFEIARGELCEFGKGDA